MAFSLNLGNLIAHLLLDTKQYDAMLKGAERKLQHSAQQMQKIGRSLTMKVTLPILAIGAVSAKAFASFDDAMVKSTAIMGKMSTKMRSELERTAVHLSTRSVTSATDLAKSYFYLASAGLDAQQSLAALPVVEKFAVAGAFDMALATDLVTDAQSALGLTLKDATKNMQNMTRVADVLTGANTLANATTLQFSKALTSQAGPAMKSYGVSLEEGVAVLAAYADQGIKAERAGNMFGRMLRLMTKGFKDNKAAWERLGLTIYDARNELRPMSDIVGDLSKKLGEMSTRQKIAKLNMLGFQARSQQAILPLLGLGSAIAYYQERLEDMKGITEEIYKKQLKSFASQMKILWNNIVAVGISIGRVLAPKILKLNETLKKATDWWRGLNDSTKIFVVETSLLVAAIGPALLLMSKMITTVLLLKVAMFAAAGAVTALTVAFVGLGTAIASYSLGKWARENLQWAAEAHEKIAAIITETLLAIQYKTTQIGISIKIFWKQTVSYMRLQWIGFVEDMTAGLVALQIVTGVQLGGAFETLNKHIESMKNTIKETDEEVKKLAITQWQNAAEYIRQIDSLEQATKDKLAIIAQEFAEKGEAAGVSIDELTAKLAALRKELEEDIEKKTGFIATQMESLDVWITHSQDMWARFSDVAVRALDSTADAINNLMITAKADMKQLAISVLSDLNRMIIRMMLARALFGGPGGGGGLMGGIGGMFAGGGTAPASLTTAGGPAGMGYSAGGVFSAGRIVPFAGGGIMTSPFMFPLQGNKMGIGAEKGPEMLAPVTRMPTGELGVKSVAPNITVDAHLKNVNVFDPSEVAIAMQSEPGEIAFLNLLNRYGVL